MLGISTKITVDAALFENSNIYYFSMIARNHMGKLLAACASCRHGRIAPDLVEAMGIRRL